MQIEYSKMLEVSIHSKMYDMKNMYSSEQRKVIKKFHS